MRTFKNIRIQFACFALACFSGLTLQAQQELGTHFLQGTWQAAYTNPAFMPEAKVVVSLPGFYDNLSTANLKLSDLLTTNAQGADVLDVNGGIRKMPDQNLIREDFSLETLGIGLHFDKWAFYFSHSLKFKAHLDFPKVLPQLIWQGNSQFIGQEVNFGPNIELSAWHHYAFGGAYEITKNITVGTRLKYITGIIDLSTERSDLKLSTSDDIYQLQLEADYAINTSGTLNFTDFQNYSFSFKPTTDAIKKLFEANRGFAFDVGVDLHFGKLNIAASVLDVGKITWAKNVKNYAISGVYEFEGIDVTEQLFQDTTSFSSIIDTLAATYAPVVTANSYDTALPTQFYLSAKYEVSKNFSAGALFYSEFYRGSSYPAFAVSGNFKLGRILQIGGLYAIRNRTFNNLGVNAALKLGPVQLVAMTDNLLTVFSPQNSHSVNVRLGLNLVFGKQKEKETVPVDLY